MTCPLGQMLPVEVDQDSNFALEIFCIDGSFQAPSIWPSECQELKVCSAIPEPPEADIKLVKAHNRTQFRDGEFVYYTCQDPKAIVLDEYASGLNTWSLLCDLSSEDEVDFPAEIDWPSCYRETECTDLPSPSEESRLQLAPYIGDSVRIGDFIRYSCIDKALFHETPDVSLSKKMKSIDFLNRWLFFRVLTLMSCVTVLAIQAM